MKKMNIMGEDAKEVRNTEYDCISLAKLVKLISEGIDVNSKYSLYLSVSDDDKSEDDGINWFRVEHCRGIGEGFGGIRGIMYDIAAVVKENPARDWWLLITDRKDICIGDYVEF